MSLEAFVDIRFADPVLALSMRRSSLIYGTALGRILYYDLETRQEQVIAEFSEECIRGVFISSENVLYVAVGDHYCMALVNPENSEAQRHLVYHESNHSNETCQTTQVLMHDELVCLVKLGAVVGEHTPVFLTHIPSQVKMSYEIPLLPEHSVPYDFDGNKLLWMEWSSDMSKVFKYFDFSSREIKEAVTFSKSFGHITQVKLLPDSLLIVQNYRKIRIYDITNGVERNFLGSVKSDIVAINFYFTRDPADNTNEQEGIFEQNLGISKFVVVTAQTEGSICIWDYQGLAEVIRIKDLEALTPTYQRMQYFAMGYPYYLCVSDSKIAFSTDLGTIVVKSDFLARLNSNP